MSHGGLWWGSAYVESFQEMCYPLVLLDKELRFCWANQAADTLFSGQSVEDTVKRVIFEHGVSTILDKMRQKTPAKLLLGGLLYSGGEYLLSPVFAKDEFVGCTLVQAPSQCDAQLLSSQRLETIIGTFSSQTRTPIFIMTTALSGIERCNASIGDPDIRQYVKKISTQCYRLLRSSISVKEINRYRYGKFDFNPQRQDLGAFIKNLCGVVSVMIEKTGIQFHTVIPEEAVATVFDNEKISTVLFHLVSNAAKFMGEKGEITVSLHAGEGAAYVTVTDNGIGIPKENREHVFDDFFSYDQRIGSICGDGLGLAICQIIIQKHGGTIAITSTEGEGTKIVFSIPLTGGGGSDLVVCSTAADYMYDRFSSMFVILSDVCQAPDVADR